jgi:hypothetical protein
MTSPNELMLIDAGEYLSLTGKENRGLSCMGDDGSMDPWSPTWDELGLTARTLRF